MLYYLPKKEKYDIDEADKCVKSLIAEFEILSNKGHVKAQLALNNIRLRHPLFAKLSTPAFKFIMENSLLYKLRAGQFIYRESVRPAPNLYFIMYGSFQCRKTATGPFGALMCVGHTLGEEILFGPASDVRTESVVAKENACVLQVNVQNFARMKSVQIAGASKDTLQRDYLVLLYILENHYIQKNEWRE